MPSAVTTDASLSSKRTFVGSYLDGRLGVDLKPSCRALNQRYHVVGIDPPNGAFVKDFFCISCIKNGESINIACRIGANSP